MLSVMAGAGKAGAEVSERLITIETQQKPLKEVLQRIAGQTGYTFLFDSAWSNYPVSVRLEKASLQTSLRRILGSVNHALVYLPERTIKIIITQNTPMPGSGSAAGSPARARRPTPPNPEPPAAPEPSNPAEESGTVEEANPAESQPPSN